MSVLTSRPVLRWLVPASAGLAVVAGGAAIGLITAAADPTRPPRSAAQLLVDLQSAKVDGLSGTVVERADLGLPTLPGVAGSTDLSALLSGTHTVRLWYAAPDQARVALMGTLGETDVIRSGDDQWIWSSKDHTAHHQKTSAGTGNRALPTPLASALPGGLGSAGGLGPEQLATLALTAIGQTASVTTSGPVTVAGRDAYELIVAPKDTVSRIGSIRVALDADAHIPLRVQIFGRGASAAAIEVAFTQVTFARPDPAEFAFNPPPGTTIVESTAEPRPVPSGLPTKAPSTKDGGAAKQTAMVGTGWASVIVARVHAAGAPATADATGLASALDALPTVSGPWGTGKLVSGSLFSVLLTDDGRVLIGAVGPDQLYRAAADPAAQL